MTRPTADRFAAAAADGRAANGGASEHAEVSETGRLRQDLSDLKHDVRLLKVKLDRQAQTIERLCDAVEQLTDG